MVTETTGLALLFEGIDHFYTTHLPSAIILTVLLLGIGVGIGRKLIPILQAVLGRSQVNVNVNEHSEREYSRDGGPKLCIPDNCPDHKAEKERSLRNEKEYEALWVETKSLWAQFDVLRKELLTKLDNIEEGNQQILLALIDTGKIRPSDLPRKRG